MAAYLSFLSDIYSALTPRDDMSCYKKIGKRCAGVCVSKAMRINRSFVKYVFFKLYLDKERWCFLCSYLATNMKDWSSKYESIAVQKKWNQNTAMLQWQNKLQFAEKQWGIARSLTNNWYNVSVRTMPTPLLFLCKAKDCFGCFNLSVL